MLLLEEVGDVAGEGGGGEGRSLSVSEIDGIIRSEHLQLLTDSSVSHYCTHIIRCLHECQHASTFSAPHHLTLCPNAKIVL